MLSHRYPSGFSVVQKESESVKHPNPAGRGVLPLYGPCTVLNYLGGTQRYLNTSHHRGAAGLHGQTDGWTNT